MGSNTSTVQNQPTSVSAPFQSTQIGTTSSQVQKDPYAATLPWMQGVANAAQSIYLGDEPQQAILAQGGYATPYQTGQQYLLNSPNGVTSDMQAPLSQMGQAGNQYQQLIDEQRAQAGSSTGLSQTQNAILDQNAARLGDLLASKYSGAGRYGSVGAGIGMTRGIAETNNPLMAQFQQQNVGNTLNALGGLSSNANAQLNQYGQATQNMQRQMALQPQLLSLATAPSQAHIQNLKDYAGILSSMYPMLSNAGTITTNGNTTTDTSGFQTNTPTGTSTTSTPTPWTTYAGLGLAGIGALSDRRVKTDIKKVGKDPWTGLGMYQYRYKGQPKNTQKFVGPMAQDVQKMDPEAVGELPGGILYIKKAA